MITIQELYQIYLQYSSIQTDTRKLKQGDLYFALKGSNFNGNCFALQALEKGASYAVVDEPVTGDNDRLLLVDNVLQTLQQLAHFHRRQFSIPFIAITGSNGKTTTKELVHAVLSAGFTTYTTEGNLNNHIGIPLTLLKVRPDAEIAVIEMGANHQREIAGYCQYTEPTHGIITNCGKAHLEGFGSIEGVRRGKGELFDFIRANGGTVFAFDDYDYLHQMTHDIASVVWYGTQKGSITGTAAGSASFLEVAIQSGLPVSTIKTQLVGNYNLPNVLCAAAVGKLFGVPGETIKTAIETYTPSNSRSQLLELDGNHIILDAYNANPSSMKVAIDNFARIASAQKYLVLGTMAELGDDSLREHEQLVTQIENYGFVNVALVGNYFAQIPHRFRQFATVAEAKEWWQEQQATDAYVLIKGSRSMQMENIIR